MLTILNKLTLCHFYSNCIGVFIAVIIDHSQPDCVLSFCQLRDVGDRLVRGSKFSFTRSAIT